MIYYEDSGTFWREYNSILFDLFNFKRRVLVINESVHYVFHWYNDCHYFITSDTPTVLREYSASSWRSFDVQREARAEYNSPTLASKYVGEERSSGLQAKLSRVTSANLWPDSLLGLLQRGRSAMGRLATISHLIRCLRWQSQRQGFPWRLRLWRPSMLSTVFCLTSSILLLWSCSLSSSAMLWNALAEIFLIWQPSTRQWSHMPPTSHVTWDVKSHNLRDHFKSVTFYSL